MRMQAVAVFLLAGMIPAGVPESLSAAGAPAAGGFPMTTHTYKDMTPEVVAEPGAGGLNRGRLYLYCRQNGLWTKEVTGFDPATEKNKLDPYCPVRNITAEKRGEDGGGSTFFG
jgi:hypothetical protein